MADISQGFSNNVPQATQSMMQGQQPGQAPQQGAGTNIPPEKMQEYINKGAGGVEQLYVDAGMPHKAIQLKNLQDDIQQKVYDGNARLFDQTDRDKLIQSAQMAKAVSDQVQQAGDSEKGVGRIVDALKSIGGPDLSGYDSDIQAQGLHLWNNTFQQQMAAIAASPRGRELYGDVVNSVYDGSKNPYVLPMKAEMFASSDQGQQAIATVDKLQNPIGQMNDRNTNFWNKDLPNSTNINGQADQDQQIPAMSQGEIQQLIGKAKTALTSTPANDTFDLDAALSVAHTLEDRGVLKTPIDYSSPAALRASLFSAIAPIDTMAAMAQAAQVKESGPNAVKTEAQNNALQAVYAAQAGAESKPSPATQKALDDANKNLIAVNTSSTVLGDKGAEQYAKLRQPAIDQSQLFSEQIPVLQKLAVEKLAMMKNNPQMGGPGGTLANKIHEYAINIVGANGTPEALAQQEQNIQQQVANAAGTRDNVNALAAQAAGQQMKSTGGRGEGIFKLFYEPLANSDVSSTAALVAAAKNTKDNIDNNLAQHEAYVGQKGSLAGAPSLTNIPKDQLMQQAAAILHPATSTNVKNATVDGATAQNVVDTLPASGAAVKAKSRFSQAQIDAELARRGIK